MTIIVLDGNVNVVRGNYRHLDHTDSFDVMESRVTGQSLMSTTSLGKFFLWF